MAGNESDAREGAYNTYKTLANGGAAKRELDLAWGRYESALATESAAVGHNVAKASKRH